MDSILKNDRAAWLQGPAANCSVGPTSPAVGGKHPWRLILLGAPGVGKGTQAELLAQRLGACHLSTGDVFRAASQASACAPSPAMQASHGYMSRGELVPDATVWEMIRERSHCLVCCGGFILDGFPRTLNQAESLGSLLEKENLSLSAVIDYELPLDEIVRRLSGRRTCETCKSLFHVQQRPPQVEGICDYCAGRLYQREDDCPEAITVRLDAYQRSTAPLIQFYKKLGLLLPIPAAGSPEQILAQTLSQLESSDLVNRDATAVVAGATAITLGS